MQKLKDYYKQNDPHDLTALNPPATDKDIKQLEQALPGIMRLPKEYVEFLKLNNGSTSHRQEVRDAYFKFGSWSALPIDRVLSSLNVLNDLLEEGDFDDRKIDKSSPGVQSVWWNPKWLPIFSNGRGNYLCIDFNPSSGGKIGQIIEYDRDFSERPVKFDSFLDMLDALVNKHLELTTEDWKVKTEPKSRLPTWLQWIAK